MYSSAILPPRVAGCVPTGASYRTAGPGHRRVVALTFDDGPSFYTPQVLRILRSFKIHATFFVIGEQVGPNAGLVREELAEGHAVGDHTWNHSNVAGGGSFAYSQLSRTRSAIRRASGYYTPCVFRAPYGAVSGAVGIKRHRHQIGLAVRSLGNEVNDVEGTCRKLPRQPAEQRDELDFRGRHGGKMAHDGGKGASMADAYDLPRVALQHRVQIVRARKRQRLDRQPRFAEIGSDLNRLEFEARLEQLFELQAFRHRAIDENADQAIAPGARDQAVRLHGGNVEPRRDLALGQAAGIV